MPKINADFSKIATDFENLPEDSYRVLIEEIEEGETNENKLPQLKFKLKVMEGPMEGKTITDFVVLKQNDGKVNNIGLGRIRAYAQAILGEEAAAGDSIDTDELRGGSCTITVKHRTYKDKKSGEEKVSADIKKVLPND